MTKETGGPAFPNASIKTKEGIDVWGEGGMTLRDYFAAKAMNVIPEQSAYNTKPNESNANYVARLSYAMADAMLKAREA